MNFKIYDCDFGIKYNGVNYNFTHVLSMAIDDPENNRLTRGANAANKEGIVYKEGIKDPKKITVTIMDMSIELKTALDRAHVNQDRLDVFCISRVTGNSKMGRNAILCQQPQQISLDETAESMSVALAFETYDLSEVFKEQ